MSDAEARVTVSCRGREGALCVVVAVSAPVHNISLHFYDALPFPSRRQPQRRGHRTLVAPNSSSSASPSKPLPPLTMAPRFLKKLKTTVKDLVSKMTRVLKGSFSRYSLFASHLVLTFHSHYCRRRQHQGGVHGLASHSSEGGREGSRRIPFHRPCQEAHDP